MRRVTFVYDPIMTGRTLVAAAALVAASCSDTDHARETTGRAAQALGAPTKLKTFTTNAAAASVSGLSASSIPNEGWVDLGQKTLFMGRDLLHGKELWVTDGTSAGTTLLVDGNPGPSDGLEPYAAHTFVSNGSVAVYAGNTGEASFAWRSDGTIAGTYPLRKIVLPLGWMKSSARMGTSMFVGAYGNDVYKTDGTDAGTANFWTGGYVYEMAAGATKLFLASGVRTGCASAECLYVSDGTAMPSKVTGSPFPAMLTAVGDVLFYYNDTKRTELWKSDGTTATLVYTVGGEIYGIRPYGAGVIFFVNHTGVGFELWKSDGTTTELVSQITTSPDTGTTGTVNGAKVFFAATSPATGLEPWVSDGTTMGTAMIADLYPGAIGGATINFYGPAKYKDGVAFNGYKAGVGIVPMFTNGAAPVAVVEPTTGGPMSNVYPGYHEGPGQTLYFSAPPSAAVKGVDLWKSTAIGSATLVKSVDAPTVPAPSASVVLGGKMYFTSIEGATSLQLWASDGTGPGTLRVTTAADRTNVQLPTVMGGKIYFSAAKTGEGQELWTSDGTEAGTSMIDVYPGSSSASPYALTASGTHLFFSAQGSSGGQLPFAYSVADGLVSLGTTSSTNFTAYKNGALFDQGAAHWFSDGTLAGTVQISATPATSKPAVLGADAIYGTATGLWKTDGTAANTAQIKAFTAPIPETVTAGGYVYFAGDDGGVWKSDGTANGTTLVVDLVPISNGSKPTRFFAFGTKIVFVASDVTTGLHWWVSDGTSAGTQKLMNAVPGVCSPFVAGTTLYLCAADDAGEELWTSDGTPAGTQRWMDLNPGPYRSAPNNLALLGTKLLFSAYEGVVPSLYIADTGLPNPPPPMDGGASSSGTSGASSSGGGGTSSSSSTSSGAAASSGGAEPPSAEDSGCGCRSASSRAGGGWGVGLAVAALAAFAARRRRRDETPRVPHQAARREPR